MDKQAASLEEKPLRLLLFYVGLCLVCWSGLLQLLPSAEWLRSVLKIIVWLVPLSLFARAQKMPIVWHINPKRHWKPTLLVLVGLLVYFSIRGQLLVRGSVHSVSVSFFVNAVLIAPPVEEMVFRGVIFQQLVQKLSFWQANIGSSLLFTIYHIPLWLARGQGLDIGTIGWVLIAGILFGWTFWKTQSLGPGTIVHSLHNLFLKMLL